MFRVYYNRHSEWPLIWSIDAGDLSTEVKVKSVQFHKVVAETGFDPEVPIGDQVRPRVFFIVRHATLTIRDGTGCFFYDPDWRKPRINADTK